MGIREKDYYEYDVVPSVDIKDEDIENESISCEEADYDKSDYMKCSSMDMYIKELNRSCPPKLSPAETIELGRVIKEGTPKEAEAARNRLIEGHLIYALKIAKAKRRACGPNFTLSESAFQDVVQEATLGLYDALEKYDYTKGIAFSTYAKRFVDKRVQMCFCNVERPIKVSEYYKNHESAFRKWMGTRVKPEPPTPEEVAEALGVSIAVANKFLYYFTTQHTISLDFQDAGQSGFVPTAPDDHSGPIAAPPEDEPSYAFDKKMSELLRHEKIMSVFNKVLTARERDCLLLRYKVLEEYNGVQIDTDDDKLATYDFIGNVVGCGKVLAFYAVNNAIQKICEKYSYSDFTF